MTDHQTGAADLDDGAKDEDDECPPNTLIFCVEADGSYAYEFHLDESKIPSAMHGLREVMAEVGREYHMSFMGVGRRKH